MKELSIKEKAERYDEAIKVAKGNYETIVQMDNDCTFAKEGIVNTFHHIFPELKESEDEKFLNDIIKDLVHPWNEYIPDRIEDEIKWLKNRLKSLRPRNTWKPSDEQMKAVRLARSFVVDDFDEHPTLSEILIELEEQLKKLRKE